MYPLDSEGKRATITETLALLTPLFCRSDLESSSHPVGSVYYTTLRFKAVPLVWGRGQIGDVLDNQ